MPTPISDMAAASHLRLLVLGAPKCGKTTTCILTSPAGGVYVINSDDKYAMRPARARTDAVGDYIPGTDAQGIEKGLREAREGVKAGRYKTVIWDTITMYAMNVKDVFANATVGAKGEPDGRRYWPFYHDHLRNIVGRLFALDAHVIVTGHFLEQSAAIDGQTAKEGNGIVPMLGGQSRTVIPAMFQDVVFLEQKGGKRYFVTSAEGVFGPGCRNLPGVSQVEADVGKLWERMQKD